MFNVSFNLKIPVIVNINPVSTCINLQRWLQTDSEFDEPS